MPLVTMEEESVNKPMRCLLGCVSLSLIPMLSLLQTGAAFAHGGLSRALDKCVMQLGPYKMHFTGYETGTEMAREFCEEIPDAGKVLVVLDEFSKPMRRMSVEFRIIRDVKSLGVNAQYEQLGGAKEIDDATLLYKQPEVYENGTLTLDLSFDKGKYIGIVTLIDPETKENYRSVFPFSVGYGAPSGLVKPILGMGVALILGGVIVYFTSQNKTRRRVIYSEHSA